MLFLKIYEYSHKMCCYTSYEFGCFEQLQPTQNVIIVVNRVSVVDYGASDNNVLSVFSWKVNIIKRRAHEYLI